MAEQPDFWSWEGFPYPLLALGQTIPRGYQYQSQMTPYKRSARGDWGRALNESIDQFIGMMPQYMHQKRQFALQRDQLARQKAADLHQAKLRPFELKKMRAEEQIMQQRMQMLKNYPKIVESLPVDENIKAHLLTLPPTEGLERMKTIMAHHFKPKSTVMKANDPNNPFPGVNLNVGPGGKTTVINVPRKKEWVQPGEEIPGGEGATNISKSAIQVDPLTGTVSTPFKGQRNIVPIQEGNPLIANLQKTLGNETVEKLLPFLKEDRTYAKEGEPGEIIFPKGFEEITKELQQREIAKTAPTPSQLFQTKHAETNFANIGALGDLAEVAGNNLTAQRVAALQILPEGHVVRQRAQYDLKQAGVKMGRNGIFEPEPFNPANLGQKRSTASAPQSILVNQGDSLDQIVEKFKKQNITVDKTQVIAANKHFFPGGDPNKMKTSAQVGGAEMLIPVGGGSLNETQVNAAHRSHDPRHNVTTIPGSGTYTNFNNTTVPFQYKLNNDLADMKTLQSNVDEVIELMKDPNAISLLKTGHPARGLIEGLRWRLINNVQTLRDFGVLSPSEIDTIAKSVPDPNSFFNIVAGKVLGLKPEKFVEGVLGALKKEGETKASRLRSFMQHWNVPEIDFKIHRYDPYAGQGNQNQSVEQQLTNELSSFE